MKLFLLFNTVSQNAQFLDILINIETIHNTILEMQVNSKYLAFKLKIGNNFFIALEKWQI